MSLLRLVRIKNGQNYRRPKARIDSGGTPRRFLERKLGKELYPPPRLRHCGEGHREASGADAL